jgi:hypothetical protein
VDAEGHLGVLELAAGLVHVLWGATAAAAGWGAAAAAGMRLGDGMRGLRGVPHGVARRVQGRD